MPLTLLARWNRVAPVLSNTARVVFMKKTSNESLKGGAMFTDKRASDTLTPLKLLCGFTCYER